MTFLQRQKSVLAITLNLLVLWSASSGIAETVDPCARAYEAIRQRDITLAETLLRDCLDRNPAQLDPYLRLCGIYQAQERYDDLLRMASEGLRRFPDEKRFYLTVGNAAGRNEQYEHALDVFGRAYQRWPQDQTFREQLSSSHLMYGMQLLDKHKDLEAEKQLRAAAELSPNVDAFLNLGRALHNLNRSVEALAQFDRVLEIAPNTPLAYFHRGLVLGALGEYDQAMASLTREIQSNSDYPPSYLLRGEIGMKRGDWAAALTDLDVAVKRMPDNFKAIYTRARCFQQLGRLKEAEGDFREAIRLDPDNPDPVNGLARLLWLTDRKKEAEDLFLKGRQMSAAIRTAKSGEIKFEGASPKSQ